MFLKEVNYVKLGPRSVRKKSLKNGDFKNKMQECRLSSDIKVAQTWLKMNVNKPGTWAWAWTWETNQMFVYTPIY